MKDRPPGSQPAQELLLAKLGFREKESHLRAKMSFHRPPNPMLPSVALAIAVEMLRDGGSLCASFQGANGSTYWLVVPVRMSADFQTQLGYGHPVVVERPFAPAEVSVLWPHAETLLRQVERLLPPSASRGWVEPMYECIRAGGNWLPPEIDG